MKMVKDQVYGIPSLKNSVVSPSLHVYYVHEQVRLLEFSSQPLPTTI
jgi:hypothetical protein